MVLPVYQTDFSAAQGNALQACFASIFEVPLADVPNFIAVQPGSGAGGADYLRAIDTWLAPRKLAFVKISLTETGGRLQFPAGPAICILAGPSPRGDFKHAVVARVVENEISGEGEGAQGFRIIHDPYPDATGLAGDPAWAGFVVMRYQP